MVHSPGWRREVRAGPEDLFPPASGKFRSGSLFSGKEDGSAAFGAVFPQCCGPTCWLSV